VTAVGTVPVRALEPVPSDNTVGDCYLVVNADDFGRTSGVTRGIIRAHERGIVTSTSLMVRWPAAEEAAWYARTWPRLGVGLHVDLSEWTVVDGTWVQTYAVVDIDDLDAVAAEVERQLEQFKRLVGRKPTHIDSHQHVHLNHSIGDVFGDIARRLGVPLRQLSPGVVYRGDFYGQTSRGDPYPEGITVESLLDVLSGLPPGVTELACHPGEDEIWDSTYRTERVAELRALCDPRVRDWVLSAGIQLRSFGDVAGSLVYDADAWRAASEQSGIAAYNAGSYDVAERWFRVAAGADPASVGGWLWLSRACARRDDLVGAREALQRAMDLEPSWVSVKFQEADVLAQEGREAEAIDVLEGIVERHSSRADLLRRATQRLADLRADAASIRAADALLTLEPRDEHARFAKALALWRRGEVDEAIGLVHLDGGLPGGRLAARFLLDAGEPIRAWEAAQAASSVGLPLLLGIAACLRRAGAITQSIAALERASEIAPGNASIRRQLATTSDEASVLQGRWRPPQVSTGRFRRRRGCVLHLVGHSAPHSQAGYTVRTHSVARAQLEVGLEPHVVTRLGFPWDDGNAAAALLDELDGVQYHRLRASGGTPGHLGERLSETVRLVAELIRSVRPSVLHAASDYRNALVALTLGRAFGLPVVYEVRGFWEETRLAAQGPGADERECYLWHRERELDCMRNADRVVTLAQTMRRHLIERGVAADAIEVISNAVDTTKFHPVQRDAALAERLGIASDETVLGYISSFSSYEGIRYLIDATARLAASGERVRCLLVGEGEESRALEAHVESLGAGPLVCFTGRVPHHDVLAYYGLIDVFVVPRTADRVSQLVTPLKPYEAMATARTVVVSRVPALVEMIEDGVTGLSFRPEDADDLARVVRDLISDPVRRAGLADAGRDWVCRNRTWHRNGEHYLDLYRTLDAA